MEKIGIIVGNGKLPLYFLREAVVKGYEVFPIGLFDTIEEEIKEHKNFKMMNVGHVGGIVKHLLKNGAKKLVMMGKVEKNILFSNIEFDVYGKKLLEKLPDNKDETLLFGIIALLKLNGIKVLPQNHLLNNFMFKNKNYTNLTPEKSDNLTIKMGVEAAKSLSELDAGQTVVCKDSSVVALEGIEGTDQTILRAGKYAGDGCVIVKMARPQQDMRVDIPAIGLDTIKKAIEIGAKGIVGEAGKMLFLDQEESVKLADENNLFIMGIKP
jgi:DUF1009 family protein